nr:MAG TPA: hypothetical protein [Caudoviricetes sp.]
MKALNYSFVSIYYLVFCVGILFSRDRCELLILPLKRG